MANTSRVGGLGGGSAPGVSDKTAEDGFQQALGRSAVAPAPVINTPTPKGPPKAPQQPARPQARQELASPAQNSASARQTPALPVQARAPQTQAGQVGAGADTAPPRVGSQTSGRFSSLSDRLVEMRRTLGVTQVELAKRMGSTQPALARLEKGEMKPNLRTLARYGEAIGQRVQVDFDRNSADDQDEPLARCTIDCVPETLSQVRRTLGLTQAQVASSMETSQPVIARLESGEAVPNLRTLERYCEALDVEATISFEKLDA